MKLLNLLRTQLEKKSVGTLALGERSGFKEVFFERDHVFLCEPLISGKIDMATLVATGVLGDSLTPENLDVVLATRDLREEPLSTVLFNQNFIDETQRGALLTRQIREELLELFYLTGDSFHFQEGRVPEQLLSGQSVASRHPIDVEDLSSDLAGRLEDLRKYETILPSHEEIFVLTAEGMAYMQGNQDVGLHRVFTLIDGFRDLASLISCSRFYYHYVVQKIVESLENDFLKKRVLPEIRGIDPGLLSVDEAKSYLPHFKNAVKHSVDAMAARDRLASLYETLGMFDDAVVQYNFIGDALYRMKKPSKAIAAYQHALEIKPDNAMVTDKVIRIYQDAAEDEIEDGAADNAIQLLEKALYTRPEDTHVFQSLSAILVERGMLRDLTNLCDRVVAHARKTGNLRAGVGACRQILTLIPDSPLFQKKLVNIYLDSDQVEQAAREMAVLARIFMDRGQTERSLDMAEKVKRLRNKSPEIGQIHKNLEKELRVRGRHSRSAVV
ncbi:MAG: tetratricopeptide repeat protein, partial [Planctomycetota bacterium]|nr:tetratricopeptide repeat protein [Planctomycetota bacterium]